MLQRHPWALQLISARPSLGPNRMAWLEVALRALAGTELDDNQRFEVVRLLDRYVRGAAQDPAAPASDSGAAAQAWLSAQQQLLAHLASDSRYQTLASVLTRAVSDRRNSDDLTFGLHRVLDGVQTLIETAGRKRRKR